MIAILLLALDSATLSPGKSELPGSLAIAPPTTTICLRPITETF
jgi:hypothetical protein